MTSPLLTSGMVDHSALGRVRYSLTTLPADPDGQVAQTIALMRAYALEDCRSPLLLADVQQASQTDEPLDDTFRYLRRGGPRGMQFVRDEVTSSPVYAWSPIVEALIRPVDQCYLSRPQGDCDDFSMYGAAHLIARGVPCSFVTVAADPNEPQNYSHVYLVAYPERGKYVGLRVPVDLSHGDHLGWEVPNMFGKRTEWPITRGQFSWLAAAALAGAAYLIYREAA